MSEHFQVLRLKPIKQWSTQTAARKSCTVLGAARHNLRELQAELGADDSRIDARRSYLNEVLCGPRDAAGVAALAVALMDDCGIAVADDRILTSEKAAKLPGGAPLNGAKVLRKDAAHAVELVVSLPVGSTIDDRAFFGDVLAWAREYFRALLLSAVVHRDEATPHAHLIFLPTTGAGQMSGRDLIGDRERLQRMQCDFNRDVGARYGLKQAPKRIEAATRGQVAVDLLDQILSNPDAAREPARRAALLRAIDGSLEAIAIAFGVEVHEAATPRSRTFAGIMSRPQKAERTNRYSVRHPEVAATA
jgi:hypothetical protein